MELHVTRHTSPLTRHPSHVTRHPSHVTPAAPEQRSQRGSARVRPNGDAGAEQEADEVAGLGVAVVVANLRVCGWNARGLGLEC